MAKEKEKNNVVEAEEAPKQETQRDLLLNPDNAEAGAVSITTNVVAQIIKKGVLGVPGVARFAPKGMADLVNVFSSRAYDSSIGIEFQDGGVVITVAVLAFQGTCLPEMGRGIQDALRTQIANVTGATVKKVNVLVKDLVDPDSEAPKEEGEAEAE